MTQAEKKLLKKWCTRQIEFFSLAKMQNKMECKNTRIWPNPYTRSNNIAGAPIEIVEFGVRCIKQKIAFQGFRFKTDPESGQLVAAQILYSHGFSSSVITILGHTDKGMKKLMLPPGEKLATIATK